MLGGILFAVAFFYFVFGFGALIIFEGYFQMADGPILWLIVLAAPALLIGLIVVRSVSKGDLTFQKLADAYSGEERSLHKDAAELQLSAEHMLIVPGHESIILDFNKRKIAFPSKSLKVFQPEDLITVELLTDRDLASRVGAIQAAKNAAIGGLLFGGAGAILGALASSKGELTKVSHVGRLCCTNPVGDSSRESSVVAGGHEQTHTPRLQDQELARL